MMELLRHLADGGCTVICTTHVMENVYLTDRLFVIARGNLIFSGGAQEAREHFGVQKLTMLFDRLEERPYTEWRADFLPMAAGAGGGAPARNSRWRPRPSPPPAASLVKPARPGRGAARAARAASGRSCARTGRISSSSSASRS